jgi:hypothetical protein
MLEQGTRWSAVIAAGDHGAMLVERYADHEHTEVVTDGCASGRNPATGWAVPTETQR